MDWNVGELDRSVSGGPIRSKKMDSSNNLTPLIIGLEPVLITTNVEELRQRVEKEWHGLDQRVTDSAIRKSHKRLQACFSVLKDISNKHV